VASAWRECDMFGIYNMWRVCGENVTCLEFVICGECGENVTCLEFVICGECVERM
jgi:hypothetical protein